MIYVLILNNMTAPNIENVNAVKVGDTREELEEFYKGELAEFPWRDETWNKTFKKDSILEWYNPVFDIKIVGFNGEGIHELDDSFGKDAALRLKRSKHSNWYIISN